MPQYRAGAQGPPPDIENLDEVSLGGPEELAEAIATAQEEEAARIEAVDEPLTAETLDGP